jgi:hypothetical protein
MKTAEMPDVTTVTGAGAKSKHMAYFEDAWADVYNAEGTTEATKEIMEGLGTRAETLVRGFLSARRGSLIRGRKSWLLLLWLRI